jgi:YQGE family putative transporter
MYCFITKIFRRETTYFSERINDNVRRLVISNIFKTIQSPLVTTFLNAFIWRVSGSIVGVAIYNIGLHIIPPVAFYLNGLLLRHIDIRKLFAWGAILSGIASVLLIFFKGSNLLFIFLCGCILGLGDGFYWANRNYLEFKETCNEVRLYFYGLLSSVSSIASVLVPLIAGWFIVFGSFVHLYSQKHAYWILFTLSFILMFLCGRVILHGAFESPIPEKILLKTTFLNKRRLLNIAGGFVDGTPFIATLLILLILGNEGILGSITAIVSLITAFAMYWYGKKAKPTSELRAILASSALFLISGFCLIAFPLTIGVILFVLLYGIASSFFSMLINAELLSLSEEELLGDTSSRYSFIFDNEVFLNLGRILSLLIIIGIAFFTSKITTLVYGQILLGIIQILLVVSFIRRTPKPLSVL